MGERNQEATSSDAVEDISRPILGDMVDDDLDEVIPVSEQKRLLAEKRRRAERRLEEKRLRDELGYYDLELDDF